jgi:hypothetical protein
MEIDIKKQKRIAEEILPENIDRAIWFNNIFIDQYYGLKSGEIKSTLVINEENLAPYRQVAEEFEFLNELLLDKKKKYDQAHT